LINVTPIILILNRQMRFGYFSQLL